MKIGWGLGFLALLLLGLWAYARHRTEITQDGESVHIRPEPTEPAPAERSHHPVFDLNVWIHRHPLPQVLKKGGSFITSPAHLAWTEQIRARTEARTPLGRRVPADVFVWALGEPPKPYLTKVGGVPYLPQASSWPGTTDGKPMTFLAQFCFLDSKDLFNSEWPGDVLLVFMAEEASYFEPGQRGALRMLWTQVDNQPRWTAERMPKPRFSIMCGHGIRHRTFDYPEASDLFEAQGLSGSYLLGSLQATRIGGEPWFIQGDPRYANEEVLCVLSSIQPVSETPYPYSNRPEPYPMLQYDSQLILGDMGCLYILRHKDGTLRVAFDCY